MLIYYIAHGRLDERVARVIKSQILNLKSQMWNFVSLNFLSLECIGLVSAENEDLAVMEDESPPVSSLKGRGETTANSKERALSALHVRFDEVGLKGAERSPDGTGESPWPLRLRGHNTKFEPFDLLPLKGNPSKVRSHSCANQIFVAPFNP